MKIKSVKLQALSIGLMNLYDFAATCNDKEHLLRNKTNITLSSVAVSWELGPLDSDNKELGKIEIFIGGHTVTFLICRNLK